MDTDIVARRAAVHTRAMGTAASHERYLAVVWAVGAGAGPLLMFPLLVWLYYRLARREEADMLAQFGRRYDVYRQHTPAFIPRKGQTLSS